MIARSLIPLILAALAFSGAAAPAFADIAHIRALIADHKVFDAYLELRELAPTGDAEAQYMLGGMYHWGDVGAADFRKALYWYERSAKQGNGDAMIGLAILYAQDKGSVKLDRPRAYFWLLLADHYLKDEKTRASAAGLRQNLEGQISADETKAAEAEAALFQPKTEVQP